MKSGKRAKAFDRKEREERPQKLAKKSSSLRSLRQFFASFAVKSFLLHSKPEGITSAAADSSCPE
jgi:hypothetical protein